MERNKMEEEFRSKLNQREITPSEHAWDRLEAQLNETENKKVVPVRSLRWLYIAAGFVGIVLVGTMFFKKDKTTDQNTPVIVEQEVVHPKSGSPAINGGDSITNPGLSSDAESQVAVSEPKHPQQLQQKKTQQPVSPAIEERRDNQVAQVNHPQKTEPNAINPEPQNHNINPVNAPVDEQLAAIDPKFKDPKTVKVDAGSLLSQVDGELELSFREKVIKTAAKNYKNVKLAVANRNLE